MYYLSVFQHDFLYIDAISSCQFLHNPKPRRPGRDDRSRGDALPYRGARALLDQAAQPFGHLRDEARRARQIVAEDLADAEKATRKRGGIGSSPRASALNAGSAPPWLSALIGGLMHR
jgi:hypothetical protein